MNIRRIRSRGIACSGIDSNPINVSVHSDYHEKQVFGGVSYEVRVAASPVPAGESAPAVTEALAIIHDVLERLIAHVTTLDDGAMYASELRRLANIAGTIRPYAPQI